MGRLIASEKVVYLEEEIKSLPKGTIATNSQLTKIRKFVDFGVLVYSKWWAECSSAIDASYNDLQLYKTILQYRYY